MTRELRLIGLFGRLGALVVCIVTAACSGGGDGPIADASSSYLDSGFSPPVCDYNFGLTHVYSSIEILPEGHGIDQTGDGIPDNRLAVLRPFVNAAVADGIERGNAIFVSSLTELAVSPLLDQTGFGWGMLIATDADSPPNPSNNLDGDGEFVIDSQQLSVDCKPIAWSNDTSSEDGVIHGVAEAMHMKIAFGTFIVSDIQMAMEFDEEMYAVVFSVNGLFLPCTMHHTVSSAFGGDSLLDVLVNMFQLGGSDVDRDGDGLEVIHGDGKGIRECIDGDGTVITDSECACDPRIVDGYSTALELRGIPGRVVGILHTD